MEPAGPWLRDADPAVRGAVQKCVTSSRSACPQGGGVLPADGEPRLPRARRQPLPRRGPPEGLKPDPERLQLVVVTHFTRPDVV